RRCPPRPALPPSPYTPLFRSAVVSELLAAAAAYHAAGDAEALVLRHALQPFSPAAFGSEDTRHFRYGAHWHPAAGRLSGARSLLDRKSTRLNSSHVKISYAVF